MLRQLSSGQVRALPQAPIEPRTLSQAREIVEGVETGGEAALRGFGERFGELSAGQALTLGPDTLRDALESLDDETRGVLERSARRITRFAQAQRDCLSELDTEIQGGRAGHTVLPVRVAGCYAPGGRYPLPSSVLMTACVARAAGVETVVLASPSADPVMRAAAAIAGVDVMLCVGGAHAIGAMASGVCVPACDVIAGPGNRWVTAAKHVVSSRCAIDMLAGPSELLVIADSSADPELIAADLLAQAEHDQDARACLIATDISLVRAVNKAISRQLAALPQVNQSTAVAAIEGQGWACVVGSIEEAAKLSDAVAPEHLEIMTVNAEQVAAQIHHAGAVFIGSGSAEVLGDYGAGPNHTLPTGGTARSRGGLSVLDFLRVRTWIRTDTGSADLLDDAAMLARIEGLAAHEQSGRLRR